ncbi:NADH-dependent oxidoreductase, partial [Streptococcus suis]
VVNEVKSVIARYAHKDLIICYRLSPEEIHGTNIGYSYKESMALVAEIAREELDYISLSIWCGFEAGPAGLNQSSGKLFK